MSDFPTGIVRETAHRPYPMPNVPWIMTQSWHDLLFAHWPVAVDELRALVPPGLELDLFGHQAWVGIIPFHMTNVAPRGVPALPWVSAFPELNVRTYVKVGGRPGIYFFSLDAGNPLAVTAARTLFKLPYFKAEMRIEEVEGFIECASSRTGGAAADFVARYRPVGPRSHPEPGTLEYFLTERYCLYTLAESFHLYRLDIHHLPWPLQPAEADIRVNTMAAAARIRLPAMRPLLHFSKRQDTVAFPLLRV
jgi:uncharacterized protein